LVSVTAYLIKLVQWIFFTKHHNPSFESVNSIRLGLRNIPLQFVVRGYLTQNNIVHEGIAIYGDTHREIKWEKYMSREQ
jgi:hypothetical protein